MSSLRTKQAAASAFERIAARAQVLLAKNHLDNNGIMTPLPGLALLSHRVPTTAEATIYRPIVCLILQGTKETTFAGETARVTTGQALLVSHDVPIVARILRAPYAALVFELDLATLRSLYEEVGDTVVLATDSQALEVCEADAPWVEALERYPRAP